MIRYPVAQIDLSALRHNFERIRQSAPGSRVMSVVKANAYGHGMLQIAQALVDSDAFAVARLEEGVRLRSAGLIQPIVLLDGVYDAAGLHQAVDHDLSLVFHRVEQIDLLLQTTLPRPLTSCWLMVETGMHRLGLNPSDVDWALDALERSGKHAGKLGLMSHFANADRPHDDRNAHQLSALMSCAHAHERPLCIANSGGVLSLNAAHFDWVRPGLMLYGASPIEGMSAVDLGLKPVMQLTSRLIAIHTLSAGDAVGYGGAWQAPRQMVVGVVGIGYGDGYPRRLGGLGNVVLAQTKLPILGRISMDSLCVDLSACPQAKLGDEVVLWGNSILPVEMVAQQAGTIAYEMMTCVSERVAREYHG